MKSIMSIHKSIHVSLCVSAHVQWYSTDFIHIVPPTITHGFTGKIQYAACVECKLLSLFVLSMITVWYHLLTVASNALYYYIDVK